MAITLHDEPLEEKIRLIGRQRGIDPVVVIAQAVEAFASATPEKVTAGVQPEDLARRQAFMADFLAEMAAKTTDEDRRIAREFEADMYDENGLPK